MDSTRGNPFPQSAIAEYKVISQNYKAEFDQVSSVAITAVTKSGTNELHGEAFIDHTGALTAYSPNEKTNKANGNDRAPFTQDQYGFTLGGPIVQNLAHWFVSYEGKDIDSPRNVGFGGVNPPVPNAGLAATFFPLQGSHTDSFKENLVFGKIDVDLGDNQRLELTGRIRREKDHIAEDPTKSAPGNDKGRINDETRLDLKHEWSNDKFLNEARVGYERYEWSPNADNKAPEIKYFISPDNTTSGEAEIIRTGGSPDAQDKKQTGILLQDDLTYTGMAGHAIKVGAKVKFMSYDLSGAVRGVDVFQKLINNQTGNLVMFGANDYFQLDAATTPTTLGYKNKQFGIYVQDDWAVTKKLELNLGVRYDYETNMLNNGYVTPADRVAALFELEPVDANGISTRIGGIPVTPGQTYDQSLAKGGVNMRDYIANGSSRKAFTGAIQPRVGFSYDINGDKNMVVFAGVGRAYDRTIADYAIAELANNAAANGDVYLIKNGYKMPYTDQFSLGLRKGVAIWNTGDRLHLFGLHNQFNWTEGNRDPSGGVGGKPPSDALFGGPPGFGNLVLGDFTARAKTQTVYLKADKPYTDVGLGIRGHLHLQRRANDEREPDQRSLQLHRGTIGVALHPVGRRRAPPRRRCRRHRRAAALGHPGVGPGNARLGPAVPAHRLLGRLQHLLRPRRRRQDLPPVRPRRRQGLRRDLRKAVIPCGHHQFVQHGQLHRWLRWLRRAGRQSAPGYSGRDLDRPDAHAETFRALCSDRHALRALIRASRHGALARILLFDVSSTFR